MVFCVDVTWWYMHILPCNVHITEASLHTLKPDKKPYKDKNATTAYSLTVISIHNKKSVPVNQWFPHTTHNCVSATAEPITTATDRTPTLQRSLSTIHEHASATQSVPHQSNTRTSYKTFISNATHVTYSDKLFAIRTPPPSNTNNDRAQGRWPPPKIPPYLLIHSLYFIYKF